jgi:hypothetical protein
MNSEFCLALGRQIRLGRVMVLGESGVTQARAQRRSLYSLRRANQDTLLWGLTLLLTG